MTPLLRDYRKAFLVLLGIHYGFRILYLLFTDLQLADDEAYYWDWSRHLDWSYYSKGPLVAYLIALSTAIGGDHEFFIRLPAVILSGVSLMAAYQFAREFFDSEAAGFWTAATMSCTPLLVSGSVLMTIDNPVFCFWGLSVLFTWWAVRKGTLIWWVAAGVAVGIGLMAKAVAIFYVPSLLLFLLWSKEHQRLLLSPGPYLAVFISILFLLPQVYWNSQNDWVMFRDFAHKGGAGEGFTMRPLKSLEFIGTQVGILTPFIFAVVVYGIVRGWKPAFAGETKWQFLFSFGGVVMVSYLALSLKTKTNPNWMLITYFPFLVGGVGTWLDRYSHLQDDTRLKKHRVWTSVGLATGFLPSYLLLFTGVFYALGINQIAKVDPTNRLYGGEQLAAIVDEIAEDYRDQGPLIYASSRYQDTALLAFYGEGQPHTYCIRKRGPANQYYFINDFINFEGTNALYLTYKNKEIRHIKEIERFESYEHLGEIEIKRGNAVIKTFNIYFCRNARPWFWRPVNE